MEKIVQGILTVLLIPLFLLNIFGFIVSGIILLFSAEWTVLIAGILYSIFGTFLISLLLLPVLAIGAFGAKMVERRNSVGAGLSVLLSTTLIYGIFLGLSYAVFYTLINSAESVNEVVVLVWAYACAAGPWAYMASKEQSNSSTQLTNLILSNSLIVTSALILFSDYTLRESFDITFGLLVIPLLATTWYSFKLIHNSGESIIIDPYYDGEYTNLELEAYVICMVHVAAADNVLSKHEVNSIRKTFMELTGERIGVRFVKRVHGLVKSRQINFYDYMESISGRISEDMASIIAMASFTIAKSDNKVTTEEKDTITELHKLLGFTKKDIASLLKKREA